MVFTQIFRRLIGIAVIIPMVSCTAYRTLQVEILQPAKIPVEKGKRIAFMDRNIRRENHEVKLVNRKSEFELTMQMVRGMNMVFTEMNYDTLIPLGVKDQVFLEGARHPVAWTVDSVHKLCLKYNVDYIVSIEIQEFEIRGAELLASWFVRLYKDGIMLPVDSAELQNILPLDLENSIISKEMLEVAYWDEGAEYARRLVPSWRETERRVYVQGRTLGLGDYYLQNGDTGKALQIWKGAFKLSDKTAVKAGINLAWVHENAGDFNAALTILLEAEKIALARHMSSEINDYLKDYIKIITERIQHNDILNQQIEVIGN